ncbi:winged helix-turn-helix transcriptional regulator [Fredinandcohnia humi]
MKKNYNLPCNIAETLNIIGDKWTLLIIRDLLQGINKFSDLRESLSGIAPNVLSDRLRILEEEKIVETVQYSKHPPRFHYELTRKGVELKHVLNTIAIWGNSHLEQKYYEVIDRDCGHEVEIAYYCPVCEKLSSTVTYKNVVK